MQARLFQRTLVFAGRIGRVLVLVLLFAQIDFCTSSSDCLEVRAFALAAVDRVQFYRLARQQSSTC